jgi:hypothetical protein
MIGCRHDGPGNLEAMGPQVGRDLAESCHGSWIIAVVLKVYLG